MIHYVLIIIGSDGLIFPISYFSSYQSLTDGDNSSPEVEYIEVAEEPEEDTVEEVIAVALEEKVEIEAVKEVVELIEKTVELAVQDPVPSVVVEVHEIATPATIQPEPTHVPEVVREREIVQTQELVQESSVPKAFLKMGKWEAPESSAFQFGSFGNFGSSTNEDSIVMSTPAPWGGVAESSDLSQQQGESAGGVWGGSSGVETSASSSSGASTMSALFPQSKGLPSVQSDSSPTGGSSSQNQGRYDQKPSAPPGLDPHPHSGMTKPLPVPRQDSRTVPASQSQARGKHEANQLQQQQYQPQYQQPAAIPPAARGAPIPASMPYGYAPGFDPQYQASYQPAPVMPPPVTGSSPVTAPGAPSAQSQGQVPVAPQGQLQYGPPPGMPNHYANPYYGNPYYGNPYFYGQPQVQNPYYNQARDYQSSRPYGADPYAPGVQYPVYQQGGSFPDASGAYPNMPMQQQQQQQQQQQHPSMGSQSQGVAAAPGTPAAGQSQGQGKQQKGASASSAVPQQQQQQQQLDPNLGYGYNPYNPREAQWQYQQGAQGWGGASMMGFSVGPGGSPPSQGFPQGQSPQQSAAQGQRPSTSYGGPPGHGQGQQHQPQQGSFSRGPAPNATGQGPSSGTGQHW